jgi:subtilisin family serine protease
MHKTCRIPLVSLVLTAACGVFAGCASAPTGADGAEAFGATAAALVSESTGRVIVKFEPAANPSERAAAHARVAGAAFRTLRGGEVVVRVPQARTAEAVATYRANPNVVFAEVDALMPADQVATLTSNDPLLASQWQHTNIEASGGWAYGTGASSVLLAICDTGVSATHPDLALALRMDLCFNTVDNAPGNCGPVANHGTAVAGSAAAVGDNGLGVAGTAWAAQIIPVRVSNALTGSAYISDMAECLRYSADQGAHVINLSYQTYSNGTIYQTLLDAATYAEGKGALTVMAAGNENTNAVTSQDPATILYVAATTSTNAKSSFSNFGTYVDIAAPGSSIYTTNVAVTCNDANANGFAEPGDCTSGGDGYVAISGTSFSAPITAGAAVVLKALRPTATPAEIRNALTSTATDLGTAGEDANFGAGLLNLRRAAQLFATTTPPPPETVPVAPTGLAATVASRTVALRWTDNATNEGGYYVDRAAVNKNGSLGSWAQAASLAANATSVTVTLTKGGNYAFRVRAYNGAGSAESNVVRVTVR